MQKEGQGVVGELRPSQPTFLLRLERLKSRILTLQVRHLEVKGVWNHRSHCYPFAEDRIRYLSHAVYYNTFQMD